jgi:hypothetical protein
MQRDAVASDEKRRSLVKRTLFGFGAATLLAVGGLIVVQAGCSPAEDEEDDRVGAAQEAFQSAPDAGQIWNGGNEVPDASDAGQSYTQ